VASDFVPLGVCTAKRTALYAELGQIILQELHQKQNLQLQQDYSQAIEKYSDEKEMAIKAVIRVGELMHFLHQLTVGFAQT
jgi:hypothetical protein